MNSIGRELNETQSATSRQEKLASLGVFAAGIAHEIRNPLTAIKVRLFSLKSSVRPGTSEHEDFVVIENEINRLEAIVRDFLQFARPSDPAFQTIPVRRLLDEVSQLLGAELTKRSIRLKLEVETDQSIKVDPDKMKQVLINLIQNAADSGPTDHTVTLRARSDHEVVDNHRFPLVVIDVSDTGKGMPREVESRLFDPFFTTKEKGTGLGLPIAARIIDRHGGNIRYKTEPGSGTTFSIILPLAQEDDGKS